MIVTLTKGTRLDLSYAVRSAIVSGSVADAIALAERIDLEWEREFGDWNREAQDLHRGGESLEAPVMWGKHERIEFGVYASGFAGVGIEIVVLDALYLVDSRFAFPAPPWSEQQIADLALVLQHCLDFGGSA